MANLRVMRVFLRCLTAAIAIAIAGCASSSPSAIVASAPEHISAPLNLCAPTNAPPKDVAAQAGYVQYAVTVTDAGGNPVRDLKQSDFVAYAGTQQFPIKYFREDKGDTPQSIVIVVDESGSMTNKLVVQDQGALQRVRQNIGDATKHLNKCDEVAEIAAAGHPANESKIGAAVAEMAVGSYLANKSKIGAIENDKIRVVQPLTTDHVLALSRITEQVPWGQTPLYDGITQGLELLESAHYPNRDLIVITDGLDNSSDVKLDEVLSRAEKESVPIYMIGIGDPSLPPRGMGVAIGPFVMGGDAPDRVDADALKSLSMPSGGQYYVVSELAKDNGSGFVAAIGEVADALGHSYAIGVIDPSSSTPGKEPVTIGLANAGTLRVNARKLESTPASAP
jgi:Mg-chelatase subunit ChlD